ncbi:PfkB family carbohydrate kinase [Spiroplasma clarkii]|uniref:PfkB family carbohydrate kinase n=1 Tax=Spiroplasma clarkii TaxID=2139 RepID=UPI0011BAB095
MCIGEALIDVIKQGDAVIEENVGGAPLNVACSIGHLKGSASFYGAIGKDDNGQKIINLLKSIMLVMTKCKFLRITKQH